ncbi:MAG: RsiV family protein [Clostridiales Family XIII bacterium]|jgi:hypothetical protein|nr:RsiV family protein [Clostridiales Family XIII bacterium]
MYQFNDRQSRDVRRLPVKKSAAQLIFFMAALLLFSGCGPGGNETGSDVSDVKEASIPAYIINNRIEFSEVEAEKTETGFSQSYGKISGLADSAVEEKINSRIHEYFLELKDRGLPPYRGVKRMIPDGSLMLGKQINISANGNFNDMLSISFYRSLRYALPDSDGNVKKNEEGYYEREQYVSDEFPLNFDLRTGEELSLKDLFREGADYIRLVDEHLRAYLQNNSADDEETDRMPIDVIPVGPWKSVSPDQKFYFSSSSLYLVFDYDTPQFQVGAGNFSVIPLSFWDFAESIAVYDRLSAPESSNSLYTSGAAVKELIFADNSHFELSSVSENSGRVSIKITSSIPPNMPQPLKDQISDMLRPDPDVIGRLNQKMEEFSEKDYPYANYTISVSCGQTAKYYTLRCRTYTDAGRDNSAEEEKFYTWNADTLREVKFPDLFIAGFDYESLLRDLIEKQIANNTPLYDHGAPRTGESLAAEKKRLVEGILASGVWLNNNSVVVLSPLTEQNGYTGSLYILFNFGGADGVDSDKLTLFSDE